MGIFSRFKQPTALERAERLDKLKEQAVALEGEAKLVRDERSTRGRIKKAKQEIFSDSFLGKASSFAEKTIKNPKSKRVLNKFADFGENMLYGSAPNPPRSRKRRKYRRKIKRQRSSGLYDDIGTDRFF